MVLIKPPKLLSECAETMRNRESIDRRAGANVSQRNVAVAENIIFVINRDVDASSEKSPKFIGYLRINFH